MLNVKLQNHIVNMNKHTRRSLSENCKPEKCCDCEPKFDRILQLVNKDQQYKDTLMKHIKNLESIVVHMQSGNKQQSQKTCDKSHTSNKIKYIYTISDTIHRQHKQTSIIIIVVLFIAYSLYVFV